MLTSDLLIHEIQLELSRPAQQWLCQFRRFIICSIYGFQYVDDGLN
jgi:hypothetical protein